VTPPKSRPLPRRGMSRPAPVLGLLGRWIDEPQPILRLELVRIFAPLAILGFMSGRLAHADEWLGEAGFHGPDLGGDYRQPLYLPALPGAWCWGVAAVMVASGIALSAGFRARQAAFVFAVSLAYVALADRLAAFTVSKMSPVVALALCLSPCGARFGVSAFLRGRKPARKGALPPPSLVAGGSVRFFQALLVVMYCSSGVAKARGDWLGHSFVLWSHLHDSYQTWFSWLLMRHVPWAAWTVLQGLVLGFEVLAPLWFSLPRARVPALLFGVGMHAMIGMMFWPVRWFALLMMSLLVASFTPEEVLLRLEIVLRRPRPPLPR
jgi:hypothetical protein